MVALLLTLLMASVDMAVELPREQLIADERVEGKIAIRRPQGVEIDEDSFHCEGDRFDVEFLHDSRQSAVKIEGGERAEERYVTSHYRFFLPPHESGRYTLPPLSAHIGSEKVVSEPLPYRVFHHPSQASLVIEPYLSTKGPIYPGQRLTLGYNITSSFPIELVSEEFPLPDTSSFRKIGGPTLHKEKTSYSLLQQVEVLEPGTYTFGPAKIAALAYTRDFLGRKKYGGERLEAMSEPLDIVVFTFPPNAPLSFNGTVGNYKLRGHVTTPKEVLVGDRLELALSIEGRGEKGTIRPLNIASQLGSSFHVSDLPPRVIELTGGRQYIYELRPLEHVDEIPSIEFTSFSPEAGRYVVSSTPPLALQIGARHSGETVSRASVASSAIRFGDLEREESHLTLLAVIPLSIAAILLQLLWRSHLVRSLQKQDAKSLFRRAVIHLREGKSEAYDELAEALRAFCRERGRELDEKIVLFLEQLEINRYARENKLDGETLIKHARHLIASLK